MSWKALLDQTQVKQFKAAVACLAKIGNDLLIEAVPSKLILRSLNASHSAFAAITFHNSFFDSHATFDSLDVKGSILVKHALALFRTPKIQKLAFQLDVKDSESLTATITSESGLEKIYKIPCLEQEILQATVDRDSLPTYVLASASELNKLLTSFQSTLAEITIIALPENMHDGESANAVQIHSYVDPAKRQQDAMLHTQISINTHTNVIFLGYRHTADDPTDVTFNLRDFRVMLAWCIAMSMEIAIRFQSPGAPLLVEPHCPHGGESDIEAQLVLATLLESQSHRVTSGRQPGMVRTTQMRSTFRTPGGGRTPNIPGDTPSTGRLGGRGRTNAAGAAQAAPQTSLRRSRFAPHNQRQPSFETPGPSGRPAGGAQVPESLPRSGGQQRGLQATGVLADEEGGNSPARVAGQQSRFESMGPGLPGEVSFEEEEDEDEDMPIMLRSRYDPAFIEADDNDDDSEGIPGTP